MKYLLFFALFFALCCTNSQPPTVPPIPEPFHVCKQILTAQGDVLQSPTQAVGAKGKYWQPGQTIKVQFRYNNPARIAFFKQAAADWSKHANLKFEYVTTGGDIRVEFADNDGSWSYIGTGAKDINKDWATMNLGWDGYDVALHELGHALGLYHEQSNYNNAICWNKEKVIKDLSGSPNFWSKEMIDFNVFRTESPSAADATAFDPVSIMQYDIPGAWTCDGKAIPGGKTLSKVDADFIAKIYPYPVAPTTIKLTKEQAAKLLATLEKTKADAEAAVALAKSLLK